MEKNILPQSKIFRRQCLRVCTFFHVCIAAEILPELCLDISGDGRGTGIGTDPRFRGSIWTQIWTWLDLNPVIGVEIFTKYAGILFTYYIIILGGVGGPEPR